jgi:hypothetical protein
VNPTVRPHVLKAITRAEASREPPARPFRRSWSSRRPLR